MFLQRLRVARLNCQFARPRGATAGLPVVYIHGLGGGTWGWENFQRRTAERGRAAYALELPLHEPRPDGRTDERLGQYSVEGFALHAGAALAEIGDCFVVGHSMGGLIAQKLAECFPRAGYVFLCSAPPWHMLRGCYWPMWRHMLRHPWREMLAPVAGSAMILDDHLGRDLVNNRLEGRVRKETYMRDVPDSGRASLQMAMGWVKVDERWVDSPRLVVGGEADRLIPPVEQRRLARHLRCPLRMFDRGHMLIIEEGWEEVVDSLLDWMADVETGKASEIAAEMGR